MIPTEKSNMLERARQFIEIEAAAVAGLTSVLGPEFERSIEIMLNCQGRVIATGMGKAGIIARKAAATLASTGTPSVFVHPAEGIHGDLGMITRQDVILAFSHKGQTDEVLRIIPYFKHIGIPLIAVTSNSESELARHSDVTLLIEIEKEACPLNLAPTSSTTAMVALADTLALVLLEARGFSPGDYAIFHPGGSLGRRLLTKVKDIMHSGEENPVINEDADLRRAILVMTEKKLACVSVVDNAGKLIGFFTTGDLSRYLVQHACDMDASITTMMTPNPKVARPDMMAVKALEIMREYKIIELPVVDENHAAVGLIHLHDITRSGIA